MSAFLKDDEQEACDLKQVRLADKICDYAKNGPDNRDYDRCMKSSLRAQHSKEPCTSGGKRRKTIKKTKKSRKKRRRTRAKKPKNKSRR